MSTYARKKPGLVASAAIAKNCLFKLDTTNGYPYCVEVTADTDKPIGITTAAVEANEAIPYEVLDGGIYLAKPSAAIAADARITGTTDGEIKTAAANDRDLGFCLVTAAGTEEGVPCVLSDRGIIA